MNLRFVERNGKMILQQKTSFANSHKLVWEDVPVVNTQDTSSYKPEQSINTSKQVLKERKERRSQSYELGVDREQEPSTIEDNVKSGVYSNWSRMEHKNPREYRVQFEWHLPSDIKYVVELPTGSRVISRDDIANAYLVNNGILGSHFYNLLKELGFE